MTGIAARTLFAEMEVGFLEPVLQADLAAKWRVHPHEPDTDPATRLRLFLTEEIAATLAIAQPMEVLRPLLTALNELRRQPADGTARDVIVLANSAFALDPIDGDGVREATRIATDRKHQTSVDRAGFSRALAVVRRTDDLLESLEKAVKAFVLDRDVAPGAFKTGTERERLRDALLADVGTYRAYLATAKAELTQLDDRRSESWSEMDRVQSTMNLYERVAGQERITGTRAQTMSPARMPAVGISFANGSVKDRSGRLHD